MHFEDNRMLKKVKMAGGEKNNVMTASHIWKI